MKNIGLNLTIIVVTAMLCITGLMVFALTQGIDGVLTSGTIAMLGGIPVWFISKKVTEKRIKNGGK